MKFRTEIDIQPTGNQIEHREPLITLGSCFADYIAQKLDDFHFKTLKNPFGVLYNPVSILEALQILFQKRVFGKEDLIYHNHQWHSFDHHSRFSHHNADICLERINRNTETSRSFLLGAKHALITLGTSWIYTHKKTHRVVANCHKLPADQFERRKLSVQEVQTACEQIIEWFRILNPEIRLIFTISPIRHLKDGFIENQHSKATLLAGLHQALLHYEGCDYFPSFEIMMDDLRDYRFYQADLIHPNQMAIDYIWEKFKDTFCTPTCLQTIHDLQPLLRALTHRPTDFRSPEHQRFIAQQLKLIESLQKQYPHLHLEAERQHFLNQKSPRS